MEDAIHGTARKLKRFLKRIHCSCDVLLKRIRYEDAILSRIATIRTDAREVVDSIMYPVCFDERSSVALVDDLPAAGVWAKSLGAPDTAATIIATLLKYLRGVLMCIFFP